MHKEEKEYDTVKGELAEIVKAIEEKEQTQIQPWNLFNVTDDVDILFVSDSVKASSCIVNMHIIYLIRLNGLRLMNILFNNMS